MPPASPASYHYWSGSIGDTTDDDAILDRLIPGSLMIVLKGRVRVPSREGADTERPTKEPLAGGVNANLLVGLFDRSCSLDSLAPLKAPLSQKLTTPNTFSLTLKLLSLCVGEEKVVIGMVDNELIRMLVRVERVA